MSDMDRPIETSTTIDELVGRWASASPSAVAVRSADADLTYADLEARSGAVAVALQALGVGPESRVGVCLPRSADAIVAFLGVLRAGGAYVPLDPAYPADRRAFMVADSQVTALVMVSADRHLAADAAVPVLMLDTDLPADGVAVPAEPGTTGANSAYVIYTSGTSGTPKGVVVEHRAVVALLTTDPRLAIEPGQVVAHLAPTAFDASVFEIWGALCRGAQVAVFPAAQISIDDLGRRLRAVRPDWLFLTTGLFQLLAGLDLDSLKSVGTLLTGGDVLQPERVRTAAGTTRTYAAYGPTETTVYASLHAASPQDQLTRVPLGRALDGDRFYVLDQGLTPVPPGEIGELFIGGGGLARGYHRRPGLTAERFLPDPFAGAPGARMYRTGDLGRVLPDGEVEFHGRVDRQVKIRGFRIEPGEIENVLLDAPGVAAAAVVAVAGQDGHKRLVAYVAPDTGVDLSVSDLRGWMVSHVPDHAVPTTYVVLDDLPLDTNGKLDRRALPSPWANRATLQGLPEYESPRDQIEQTIASAWAEALELDRVGIHDEFYMLGGDSMRSVVVLERLRSVGLRLSAAQFFTHPTVAELATALADTHAEAR